ncbi:MAG: chromosomal replication initiator protein DnaA [Oscillospiraceae bacterium]|jgi:chromosomal replication initiator protein|nr:chromosomal replication initiator protein DnaA [Oscillospiraceae bacterium]
MESFNQAWGLILEFCKARVTDVAYKTWIAKINPIELDFEHGEAVVSLPNEFYKKTIEKCYSDLLIQAFHDVFGSKIGINIVTQCPQKVESPKVTRDFFYDFSFSTYIVGSSNKFAHAAAQAVAANPADAYNPLFIYGNSGLGKTHLLYAIRNDVKINYPELNAIYIKGDEFANELIESIRRNSTIEFHQKYRRTDLFLVDDIQFIAGKDSTQEEFFHTFNNLYESRKQIVLTSDRPPKEIKTLEDRLRTRFEWGLICDIQPPDFETRVAIIKRKAESLDIDVPDDVCEFIAKKLKSNIRQLEGTVKKIRARWLLGGEGVTIQSAQSAISDILNNDVPPPLTIKKIIDEVARTYSVSAEDIRSSKRMASISLARQVSIYVTREITQMGLASIGEEFGGRDHSTVVYAISQMEKNVKKDLKLKNIVDDIIKNIRGI